MAIETKHNTRKRLMFITGEDFYFLTYNSLLILYAYGCIRDDKPFHDHRKLAYLVEFVADSRLTSILERTGAGLIVNTSDRQLLVNAYSKGAGRIALLTRLSHALEEREILRVGGDPKHKCLDFWLTEKMKGHPLFENELFGTEKENIERLRSVYSRVRTVSLETMLDHLFQNRGVSTWLG